MTKYHLFLLVVVWLHGAVAGRWLARRSRRGSVLVSIPDDLRNDVADALTDRAGWFRNDLGHDMDGRAALLFSADRLDNIAENLTRRAK